MLRVARDESCSYVLCDNGGCGSHDTTVVLNCAKIWKGSAERGRLCIGEQVSAHEPSSVVMDAAHLAVIYAITMNSRVKRRKEPVRFAI